jgi:hypothetical protein
MSENVIKHSLDELWILPVIYISDVSENLLEKLIASIDTFDVIQKQIKFVTQESEHLKTYNLTLA